MPKEAKKPCTLGSFAALYSGFLIISIEKHPLPSGNNGYNTIK